MTRVQGQRSEERESSSEEREATVLRLEQTSAKLVRSQPASLELDPTQAITSSFAAQRPSSQKEIAM
eukprot:CAMPEP_0168612046 /NCGR_PEP_ID=MMETSP0449_2-20121227/2694_1 /TAXON_ID=1082188 /ORGANISM="Strombidium rassoulzadegani, Strain ras09" /LENGTH=66 /DNA_ID=CAMNT_0008652557 /DNA_START=484 /DNA_END=684 /DNA_ORIENTATION=+